MHPQNSLNILIMTLPISLNSQPGADPESSAGGGDYGERGSASLYGGLGLAPVGSRGKLLVRGSGGRSPPEADA